MKSAKKKGDLDPPPSPSVSPCMSPRIEITSLQYTECIYLCTTLNHKNVGIIPLVHVCIDRMTFLKMEFLVTA